MLKRLIRASKNSIDGFIAAWKNEQAFRLEIYLGIILIPLILFLPTTSSLKLLLVLLYLFSLTLEITNSAIETIVDRISTEIHEQSRIAKDLGSAAVCMTFIMNVVAWVYVLLTLPNGV